MSLATIKPSRRLQRAAEAEREELLKTRQQLLSKREEVLGCLHELDDALAEVRDREMLLNRLAPATAMNTAEVTSRLSRNLMSYYGGRRFGRRLFVFSPLPAASKRSTTASGSSSWGRRGTRSLVRIRWPFS